MTTSPPSAPSAPSSDPVPPHIRAALSAAPVEPERRWSRRTALPAAAAVVLAGVAMWLLGVIPPG